MNKTQIEWTDSTWNPSTGCTKISSGCKNCYAERLCQRLRKMGSPKYANGFKFAIHPEELKRPLQWRRPRMVFVNSMSDLFHEEMPDGFLADAFDVMEQADWHAYQILTKRPQRMADFIREYGRVPDHVWMGVTVEEAAFKNRIDVLRKLPCRIRFVSFEPLIGSVGQLDLSGISWGIVGGESGCNRRPMRAEWAREIRNQAVAQHVAFFFKQWGGVTAKSGGRVLDGRVWDEYPAVFMPERQLGKRKIPRSLQMCKENGDHVGPTSFRVL